MSRKKRISREEHHARMMRTDDRYREFAEFVDSRRTPAEREAFPLGSEAFSREVDRGLRETLARYEGKFRRANS